MKSTMTNEGNVDSHEIVNMYYRKKSFISSIPSLMSVLNCTAEGTSFKLNCAAI